MKYYFEDTNKQKELKVILDEWLGTPFRHRCAVKGEGADCIHFVAAVLDELGILDFNLVKIPDYAPDWHLHNTREMLLENVKKHLNVEVVPIGNNKNGDIILSHFGKAASHSSIYFDDHLYHALNGVGVVAEQKDNSIVTNDLKYALRILK